MSPEELDASDLASLPMFPLPDATLLPGMVLPLHIFEPRYRELARDALSGRRTLAIARLKPGYEVSYGGRPPVFEICGGGRIVEHVRYADGRYDITLQGVSRVRVLAEHPPTRAYRVIRAELMPNRPVDSALNAALKAKLTSLWHVLSPHLPDAVRDLNEVTRGAEDAGMFADRLGAMLAGDPETAQRLLSESDPSERLQLIIERLQALSDALQPPAKRAKTELN